MSGPDATYYTGRFLELLAADEAKRVDVLEIEATDEQGRTFFELVGPSPPKSSPEGKGASIYPME